jgi:hypothetical protein
MLIKRAFEKKELQKILEPVRSEVIKNFEKITCGGI